MTPIPWIFAIWLPFAAVPAPSSEVPTAACSRFERDTRDEVSRSFSLPDAAVPDDLRRDLGLEDKEEGEVDVFLFDVRMFELSPGQPTGRTFEVSVSPLPSISDPRLARSPPLV